MSILDNLQKKYGKSLLNKKEVATELNISQATLDRLRKTGEIKSKKVGGGVFFTIKEISLFLES